MVHFDGSRERDPVMKTNESAIQDYSNDTPVDECVFDGMDNRGAQDILSRRK